MAQPMGGRTIEVRTFKWPRRPHGMTNARYLGEDAWGHWLGVTEGDPWWHGDGRPGGTFVASLVKVVPTGVYWSACFQPVEPVVDVDIVLPARWHGDMLAEVDLELDILRSTAGDVWVRDQDEFARVRRSWPMPAGIMAAAEATCARVQAQVAANEEPFGTVGGTWLARFLAGH